MWRECLSFSDINTMCQYRYKRCSKKDSCKQCRYVKFNGTMTKWPVQKPTHRTTQKCQYVWRQVYCWFYFIKSVILDHVSQVMFSRAGRSSPLLYLLYINGLISTLEKSEKSGAVHLHLYVLCKYSEHITMFPDLRIMYTEE